jgi:hypothetical protein
VQTDNGWPAAPDLTRRLFSISGAAFVGGIADDDDVELVLRYVLQRVADEVEAPVNPGCWGFAFRENRNDPNSLSRHSGGIAVDHNAPAHPNGVPTSSTFTQAEIDRIRRILADLDVLCGMSPGFGVVCWGGDFNGTPDAMHFEVDVDPLNLRVLAARARAQLEDDMPAPKDWDADDWAAFRTNLIPSIASAVWAFVVRPASNTKNRPAVTEQTAKAAIKKAANGE